MQERISSIESHFSSAFVGVDGVTHAKIYEEVESVIGGVLAPKKSLAVLLRFLVDQTLENGGIQLKEFTVATLVFNKAGSFDPRINSLVRTQVSKLRRCLARHYAEGPKHHGPWIWVPPGAYRVVFDQNPSTLSEAKPHSRRSTKTIPVPWYGTLQLRQRVISRNPEVHSAARSAVQILDSAFKAGRLSAGTDTTVPIPDSLRAVKLVGGPAGFTVEQTFLESNGSLLVTCCLIHEPWRTVIYAQSCTILWPGDEHEAAANLSPHLRAFVAHCFVLTA